MPVVQYQGDGRYGEPIPLPLPYRFSLATDGWPRWTPEKHSESANHRL